MANKKWYENFNLWMGIVAIAVIVFLAWPSEPGQYDDFATCLSEAGIIMHGTDWCSHCQAQKAMFGSSFDYVNYVNCDFNKETCLIAGVTGYPTWTIDGQNYPGQQPLAKLASLSGCAL